MEKLWCISDYQKKRVHRNSVLSVVLWYHRETTEGTTSDWNEHSENRTESHLLGWLFFVSEYQGKEGEVSLDD